jgi:hypothetical protein
VVGGESGPAFRLDIMCDLIQWHVPSQEIPDEAAISDAPIGGTHTCYGRSEYDAGQFF